MTNPVPPRRRRRVSEPEGPKPPSSPASELREKLADVQPVVSREGDMLHVRFPEITLPLAVKYATAKIGGSSYSRTLEAGEDVGAAAREIAIVLHDFVFEQARDVLAQVDRELVGEARRGS